MAYFIYENWHAGPHKAVLHVGECGHCNEGIGRVGVYDPSHAKWHGPFDTISEARNVQQKMNVVVRKDCPCMSRGK